MGLVKKAKEMISRGLIEPGKEGYYDVDGQIVRLTKKRGGTLISCSCTSCTRFCNESNICSRKLAVLLFEAQDPRLKKLIRENEEYLTDCKKLDMQPTREVMNVLLNDLKRFIL